MLPPAPWARNCRTAARLENMSEERFRSIVARQPSSVSSCSGPSPIARPLPPATWYSPWKPPNSRRAISIAFTAVLGSMASAAKARAAAPSSVCAERAFSSLRPTTPPRAPLATNARAADRPRPVVPPIMTIDFPSRSPPAMFARPCYGSCSVASKMSVSVGGSSKGDLLGEQKETALEGEFSEDIGPAVEWRLGRVRHYPELALGMIDEGHGVAQGGTDLPTAAEEVDLVVGVETAAQVQSQMEVPPGLGRGRLGARSAVLGGLWRRPGLGRSRWCGRRCGSGGPIRNRARSARGRSR